MFLPTILKRDWMTPTFSASNSRSNCPLSISWDTARPCLSSTRISCSRHPDSLRWTYTPWSAIKNFKTIIHSLSLSLCFPFRIFFQFSQLDHTWYIKVSLKNTSSTMHEYSEYATLAFNSSWRIFIVPGTMLCIDSLVGSTIFFNKSSFADASRYTFFQCTSVCLSSHAISSSGFSTNISYIEQSIGVWKSKNH